MVDADQVTKAMVGAAMIAMATLLGGGAALVALGVYYTQEVSGEGFGDGFLIVGLLLFCVGALGIVAAKFRMVSIMLVVEFLLLGLLIALYSCTIVAIMLATETTNPVTYAIDEAWTNGYRGEVLESVTSRWCKCPRDQFRGSVSKGTL